MSEHGADDPAYTPVMMTVIWEPRDMPDIRLMQAIERLIDCSARDGMNDEQIDAALEYVAKRRRISA